MTHDPELEAWRSEWQSRQAIPQGLRRRVEREIRAARYAWLPPIAVTVIIGGGALAWAVVSGDGAALRLALATWVFIAITWITSVGLRDRIGGSRTPEATTSTAFLDFAIRACRGKRATIVAAAVLCPIFVSFMLMWRYQTGPFTSIGEYLRSSRVLVTVTIVVLLAFVGWRRHRRLKGELETLLATQRHLHEQDEVSPGTAP